MTRKPQTIKTFLLNQIELLLTAFGLVGILLAGLLGSNTELQFWKVTAVAAVVVGILHGVLFWLIRRRQRLVRAEAIEQVQDMLEDLIKNKLQVIKMTLYMAKLRQEGANGQSQNFQQAYEMLRNISDIVDHLSEESLSRWRDRYQQTLQRVEGEATEP